MAKVKDATLSAAGTGASVVMTLDVEINWDRGDDNSEWELQIRFLGADVSGDDTLLVHAVPANPAGGDRQRVEISGGSGVFDEDRGEDEVYAEVELVARATDTRIVKTNTVKGDFAG